MLKYHGQFDFGARKTYDDGIESDFTFDAYEDALPAWRYPNLTQQTDFLGHVVQMTIEVEMSKEASYLRDIERAFTWSLCITIREGGHRMQFVSHGKQAARTPQLFRAHRRTRGRPAPMAEIVGTMSFRTAAISSIVIPTLTI